jgi:ribosomal RNA-processing protein 36
LFPFVRYKELRKEGKLHKFMEKRRRKNSSKDHRWLPGRRSSAGADE